MAEEITIKELLKRAGVDADSERYQELASYIAEHGVYAVDLTDDDLEENASQTQSHLVFNPNSEEEINDQNLNLPDFRFTHRCPGILRRCQIRDGALSAKSAEEAREKGEQECLRYAAQANGRYAYKCKVSETEASGAD